MASKRSACIIDLDRVGDDLARDERGAHALVAHRDAVGDRDGHELERERRPAVAHPSLARLASRSRGRLHGVTSFQRRGHADLGLGQVVVGHADGPQHGPGRRPGGAVGHLVAADLHAVGSRRGAGRVEGVGHGPKVTWCSRTPGPDAPSSVTTARPACAHSCIPPTRLAASKPAVESHSVARAERLPGPADHHDAPRALELAQAVGQLAEGHVARPGAWPASHSSGSRTSRSTCAGVEHGGDGRHLDLGDVGHGVASAPAARGARPPPPCRWPYPRVAFMAWPMKNPASLPASFSSPPR